MSKPDMEDSSIEIKISVKDLIKDFIGVMPEDLFRLYLKTNCTEIIIKKSTYDSMVAEKKRRSDQQDLLQRTAMLNNKGIELEKKKDIEGAIRVYEENIKLGSRASHSFDRLGILYRKRGDIINEKRVLCRRYEVYNLPSDDLRKELEKIDNKVNGVKPEYILPEKANASEPESVPLGIQFQKLIRLLPEFNFYCDKPEEENTNNYLSRNPVFVNDKTYKPILWQIQRKFREHISLAKKFESNYDLASASNIYEKIIAEQYYQTEPYDKLYRLYVKAKLTDEAKRVLSYSIENFTKLKEKQRAYIIELGTKYGKSDYVHQIINDNKKLFYYGGAFELYNPFPIISIWEQKMPKLK